MLACFFFQVFDKGEVYRDKLNKQLSRKWAAIVKTHK